MYLRKLRLLVRTTKKLKYKITATSIVAPCPYLCSKYYWYGTEYKVQIIGKHWQNI